MAHDGSLTHRIQDDNRTLCVEIHGSFCFSLLRDFRRICERQHYAHYIIDLRDTTYIDSSALGMLMVLHRFVGGERGTIKIVNVPPSVLDVLRIAHFHQFFDIPELQAAAPTHTH